MLFMKMNIDDKYTFMLESRLPGKRRVQRVTKRHQVFGFYSGR